MTITANHNTTTIFLKPLHQDYSRCLCDRRMIKYNKGKELYAADASAVRNSHTVKKQMKKDHLSELTGHWPHRET